MKITMVDFVNSPGHKNLYLKILSLLNKNFDMDVIVKKGFYNQIEKELLKGVNFIEIPFSHLDKKGSIISRIRIIIFMILSRLRLNIAKTDLILVLGFETITFSLLKHLFPKFKTFLFHHHNLDELDNPLKKILFSTFKNQYNHLTLDKFISNNLVSFFKIKPNLAHFINHPIKQNTLLKRINNNKTINILSLTNSNDENLIKQLIDLDKSGHLKEKAFIFYIKSSYINYKSNNLTVSSYYLSKDEYEKLLKDSDYSILLLPSSFNNRISGVMIDSLSYNLPIIAPNIISIKEFNIRYPSIVYTFNNIRDILSIELNNFRNINMVDFLNFQNNHSDSFVENQLKQIFINKFTKNN
jgi:hypothetical protein